MCAINEPKEIQVMLKVCCVSARDGAAPVISQESTTSGPETGLVVAGVRFRASVNHNGNYLKTFPVDSPAMGIDETWQVDIDSIPSKRLGRPNIHGREPVHL